MSIFYVSKYFREIVMSTCIRCEYAFVFNILCSVFRIKSLNFMLRFFTLKCVDISVFCIESLDFTLRFSIWKRVDIFHLCSLRTFFKDNRNLGEIIILNSYTPSTKQNFYYKTPNVASFFSRAILL